ncbi:MAG: class I SAM-dependent methyltransferase [Dermatophilaceae bacterium]
MTEIFGSDYWSVSGQALDHQKTLDDIETILARLGLRRGDSVLDLGCGTGRIAVELARRGMSVCGVDNNMDALALARDAAATATNSTDWAGRIELVEADMRDLPWRQQFDAVISWYTSFGYTDDDTERSILRGVRSALRENGRFLLEHVNRDRVLRQYQRFDVVEHDGTFMIDQNRYDVATGRTVKTRTFAGNGRPGCGAYSIRLFTFTEIRDWLCDAGFTEVAAFAPDGGEFTLESPRMIVVAR